MAGRKKLNPEISIGHHNYTGMVPVYVGDDVRHVRVEVPELTWLAGLDIDFDHKAGTVKVSFRLGVDAPNHPDITVHNTGAFTVRS